MVNGFNITEKNYQQEFYKKKANFKGVIIVMVVKMQYHTIRKYWGVSYYWEYGDSYMVQINGESYTGNRKETRKKAEYFMEKASIKDIQKIEYSDFYMKEIIEKRGVKDDGGF